MYRSHKLNELRAENIGQNVTLSGWVSKIRNLGNFSFIDLRDRYGITQIVLKDDLVELVSSIKPESVIKVCGVVVERQSKNPKLDTGDIEVIANSVDVLSRSNPLPFEISQDNQNENIRLTYRYLDLRKNRMLNNLLKRNKMLFL